MSFLFNEAEIYAQVTSEPLDQEEESSKVQSLNKAERKYACKSCQECVKRAPAPFSPIDKAIATSNLLAHICLRNLMIILHYIDKNVYGKD